MTAAPKDVEIEVPFSKLVRSPFNVRHKSRTPIASLAASIKAHKLLQRLLVHPMDRKKTSFGVADGWRRCTAIQQLHDEGELPADFPVKCKLITAEEARALSLAANIEREPMHPADEFEAFRLLHEDGKSIEQIAAEFGVAPLVVTRRLRLANLAPRFIGMFRDGEVDLDQMMALALTDDHEKQEAAWDGLRDHDPERLRDALTKNEVDAERDRVAKYVGLQAYVEAGGPIRRDLFSDAESGYIQDVLLLHRLAQQKLDIAREQLATEGWAWTEARIEFADRYKYERVPTVEREVTVAEAERLGAIRARITQLNAMDHEELSDEQEGDELLEDEELSDEQEDELFDLEEELVTIRDSRRVPDPRFLQLAGAVVTIEHDGREKFFRGLVRPEDRKRMEQIRNNRLKQDEIGEQAADVPVTQDKKERSAFSEKLTRNLTAHLTTALQLATARNVNVALAALAYPLVLSTFELGRSWQAERLVKINHVAASPERDSPTLGQSQAFTELQALRSAWEARLPKEDVVGWLLKLPQDDLLNLIAFCTSTSIDCVGKEIAEEAKALARAANLDMTQWWTPNAENFLVHVPRTTIVQTLTEALDAEKAAPLEKAKKKADAVRVAEQLLAGSRWLPPVLRL